MRSFNRKTWAVWLLLLVAIPSWAANHTVRVGGQTSGGYYGGGTPILMFNPPELTIAVGDTVTFQNASGPHNVHADNGSFRCANGCDGVGNGNGNPADGNWTSTVTFNQPGTIVYRCDNHGSMGMVGSITVQGTAPGGNIPITGGFTGAWYDPNQNGHGIFLEVLSSNLMLAYWFTFDPTGTQQVWFGGTGPINGTTATIDMQMATGGRWIPNFDPNAVERVPWGTLTFTFTDCTHGRVDFDATTSGYGTGHMDLERITTPVGVTCQ